jgi:hypothetical protein
MEIGGLIRYSSETGEELPLENILKNNDYTLEITDWLTNLYNERYGTFKHCLYYRMLYIYDNTGKYTSEKFISDFTTRINDFKTLSLSNFSELEDDEIIEKISNSKKSQAVENDKHCVCAINISEYSEITEPHHIIECCKDIYYFGGDYDYKDTVRSFDVTFVFISSCLPEASQIGSIYDKHTLIITPEVFKSIDIGKIWLSLKGS